MKLLSAFILAGGIVMLVMLASCQKNRGEAVAIEPNDMCAYCRMSISEKRYAAELIADDGQTFKFDDIGCMANFIKQKRSNAPVSASFVMDFERREWLPAESASYVQSSEFKTPMNGGIVAFKEQSSAAAAAAKYHGALVRFADFTK
jgi:copper chaperone NosL